MGSDDSKALRRPSRSPILLAFLLSAVCGYLLFKLTLGASSGDVDTAGAGRKAGDDRRCRRRCRRRRADPCLPVTRPPSLALLQL